MSDGGRDRADGEKSVGAGGVDDGTRLPVRAPLPSEREALIALLSEAFTRGDLTTEEFENRVAQAYRAATRPALDSLGADLGDARPGSAVASGPALPATAPEVKAVFSSVERTHRGPVPAGLSIHALFGNVEMDFRRADFGPGVTEIVVKTLFGSVELELPSHVDVELDVTALLAHVGVEGGRRSRTDGPASRPRVRVVGRAVLSSVEVEGGGE